MKGVVIACPGCGARRIGKSWIYPGDKEFGSVGKIRDDDIFFQEHCPKHPLSSEVSVEFVPEGDLRNFRVFNLEDLRRK